MFTSSAKLWWLVSSVPFVVEYAAGIVFGGLIFVVSVTFTLALRGMAARGRLRSRRSHQ